MKMLHILSFYEILFSVLSQPVYNVSECLERNGDTSFKAEWLLWTRKQLSHVPANDTAI